MCGSVGGGRTLEKWRVKESLGFGWGEPALRGSNVLLTGSGVDLRDGSHEIPSLASQSLWPPVLHCHLSGSRPHQCPLP